MSRKYEYVKWEEARPVKMELNRINQKMFSYINSNHPELCFEARVIGSGKRGLNTRVVNGNKGFDFDLNLIIDAPPEGKVWVADVVKQIFMEAADYAVKGTNYSHPKDSTRAITVKVVDKKNSKIKHSCDYAIIYYGNDGAYYYLHNDKNDGCSYSFNRRELKYPIEEMERYIQENAGRFSTTGGEWIAEEYLKVKNSDNQDKESHILYVEALYNIVNHIQQCDADDEEDEYYDDDDE